MSSVIHYACDVGSTRNSDFGWARSGGRDVRGGTSIDALVLSIQGDLASGTAALTIGMECPLFLPVPDDSDSLSTGRVGDKDRSCFAPAGGYVATLGLHQLAFLLRKLKRPGVSATVDWSAWSPQPSVVLFWEAFVSGPAHCAKSDKNAHVRDAATAATVMDESLSAARSAGNPVRVATGTSPLSLAGLALIWSGWSDDLRLLSQDVLVVKPEKPFVGTIHPAEGVGL